MSNVSSDEALKRPLSQVENGSIKKNRSTSDTDRSRLGMSKDTSAIVTDGQVEDGDGSEAETVVMPGKEQDPRASTKKTIRHESSSVPASATAESVKSDGLTNGLQTRTRQEGGSDKKTDKVNNTTENQHSPAASSPSHALDQHRSRSRATSESTKMKEDHNDGVRSGTSRKRKGSMDGLEDKSVKRRIKREDTDATDHRKSGTYGRSESPTRQRASTASSNPGSVQKTKRKAPPPLVVSAGSKGKDHADVDSNESHSPRRSAPPRVTHYSDMPKRRDKNGRTRVARACAMNNLPELRDWLEEHPEELDEADNAGNTPLQIASLQGETEIVRLLLKKGAKFDTENCDKDSPLIDAVENSHIDVVRMLLEAGVNPRKVNAKGEEAVDLVDMEHVNGPAVKDELVKYRTKWDSKRRKSTEKAPDTSRDSVAHRSPRDSPSTTTRSPPPQTTRRRAGRSEATRNDLLWITASEEALVNFAGKGDDQAISHLLNMRPISDVTAVFAAAKGGHDSCLNLLLAIGQTDQDPAPLEDQKKGYNTPMLVAIGKGNQRIIELLLEQPEFDPTRRMHKNMAYHEIAEKRQGDGWKEEYRILKAAYDERLARDGKKGSSKSSRTSSPKDSKKAQRERSPSTIVRDTSPSAAKNGLPRKKSIVHERDVKSERAQEKARLGHTEKKSERKHLKVPKHESREGSVATSDREPSPMRDRDRKSASDQELIPRPRKRLVSGKDLRDAQSKQRRNSLVSVKSVGSTQEFAKSKSSPDDVIKARHRDWKDKKRSRKSISPQPSDRARSPTTTTKRHKNNPDGSVSKSSTSLSKTSATTRTSLVAGSAPVALMGSPILGKKDLKSSSKETIHVASEDRASTTEPSERSKAKNKERSSKMSSNKMELDVPKSKDLKSHGMEHLSTKEDTKPSTQEAQSSLIKTEEQNSDNKQEVTDLPVISELAIEDHQPKPASTSPAPDIEMHTPTETSSLGKRSFSEMEKGNEQPEQPEQSEQPEQIITVSAHTGPSASISTPPDQDMLVENDNPIQEQPDPEPVDQGQPEDEQTAREEAVAREAEEQKELETLRKVAAYLPTLPKSLGKILGNSSWAKEKKQIETWLPIICAVGSDVDADCPESERDELWMPNYQATALLVDSGLRHNDYPHWIRKTMVGTAKGLAWSFGMDKIHQFYWSDVINKDKAVQEGITAQRSDKAKFDAMDTFWIRLSDFQSVVPHYEHLNDIELKHVIQRSVPEEEERSRKLRESRELKRKNPPPVWGMPPSDKPSQPPPE